MRSLRTYTFLAALLSVASAAAGTAYVTDHVLAGLYAAPSLAGEPRLALPTGSPVEVLQRRPEAVQVRLPDGSEGWMRPELLSETVPAQALLLRLADEHRRTREQLERLQTPPPPAGHDAASSGARVWPFAVVGLVSLIIGFAFGALWLDYRYRERHGGFRL